MSVSEAATSTSPRKERCPMRSGEGGRLGRTSIQRPAVPGPYRRSQRETRDGSRSLSAAAAPAVPGSPGRTTPPHELRAGFFFFAPPSLPLPSLPALTNDDGMIHRIMVRPSHLLSQRRRPGRAGRQAGPRSCPRRREGRCGPGAAAEDAGLRAPP